MNNISLSSLDLSFAPSSVMDYFKPVVSVVGNVALVGYLADDVDAENPLESQDNSGRIYTCHRHSRNLGKYQEALAIMSDGWDAYSSEELLTEHATVFKRHWVAAAVVSERFKNWCLNTANSNRQRDLPEYLTYRAKKLLAEQGFSSSLDEMTIWDFNFTETALDAALDELREQGLVGDPHAVLLDVYSHSGEHWSLAGTGMQCRFDTSRAAGVWVPDCDDLRKEIVRRGSVYSFGVIDNNSYTQSSGMLRYWSVLNDGEKSPEFTEWCDAFEWLEKRFSKRKVRYISKAMQREGEVRAAREIAESCLDDYNAWLSGDTYGQVVASFDTKGNLLDPSEWEEISTEECWGFIGSESSYMALVSEFEYFVQSERNRQDTPTIDVLSGQSIDNQQPTV